MKKGNTRYLLAVLLTAIVLSTPVTTRASEIRSSIGNQVALLNLPLLPRGSLINPFARSEENQWALVPNWLAGVWLSSSEIELDANGSKKKGRGQHNPATVAMIIVSAIGAQRDTRGRVWHFIGVPYRRVIETNSLFFYQEINKITLLQNSPNEVAVYCTAAVVRVSRHNDEVLERFEEQTTTTYKPIKDGLVQMTTATNDYDLQGRLVNSSKELWLARRTKAFQVIDRGEGKDLHNKFREFLRDNQMNNLLPAR